MSEHTPGPWLVAQQNDDYYCVETKDCAICNDVRYESDARLIAAAPELLAELIALVERCDGTEGMQRDASNMDTRAAHAAIAKAGL